MNNTIFKKMDGTCPYCRKDDIHIIESNLSELKLDYKGFVDSIISETYSLIGYCPHCKKSVYVTPINNGGYIVYPYEFANYNSMIDIRLFGKVINWTNSGIRPDPKPEDNAFIKSDDCNTEEDVPF